MILALTIIGLAFTWLLVETDFMRIRLIVGRIEPELILQYKAWDMLLSEAQNIPYRQKQFWLKYPELMTAICGNDWLESRQHVIPQYRIELKAWGVHSKVTLKQADSKVLKDLATALLKPTTTERRELTKQRKAVRA